MRWLRSRSAAPVALGGIGTALFAVAVWYHAVETGSVEQLAGPLAALAVDGLPPLGVVYAAYRLRATELSSENRWVVVTWCLAGAIAFGGVVGVGVAVRLLEGRAVTEPTFELLLGVNVGALAGTVAGYQTARVRETADRARRAKRVVGVVDGMLRHDLRNDLTVVRGRADLLEGETDGSGTEHAAVIKTASAYPRLQAGVKWTVTRVFRVLWRVWISVLSVSLSLRMADPYCGSGHSESTA